MRLPLLRAYFGHYHAAKSGMSPSSPLARAAYSDFVASMI
jgi:hypothetical protein